MTESQPAGRPPVDRLHEIDALRIFAAVAVMVYHYTFANFAGGLTTMHFPGVNLVTRFGYLGVDLFFIISGFVALLTALNRKPHQFVISRTVRLYPAYWVAVTFTTLASVLLTANSGITPLRYVANMTMFQALANQQNIDVVYWTLWAELRFYALILILTFIGMTRQRLTIALWAWLAISLVLKLGLVPGSPGTLLKLAFQPEWSHYFIAGMAMCLVYRFGMNWQLGVILVIAYISALPRAVDFARQVGERYHVTIHAVPVIAIVTAAFVVMLLVALRVTRPLARAWFVVLGALTYPLYLIHDHVGVLLFQHLQDRTNKWLLAFSVAAAMTAIAWAMNRFVEVPLAPVVKRSLERGWAATGARLSKPRTPAPAGSPPAAVGSPPAAVGSPAATAHSEAPTVQMQMHSEPPTVQLPVAADAPTVPLPRQHPDAPTRSR